MRLAGVVAAGGLALGGAVGAQAPARASSPFDVLQYVIQLKLPDTGTAIRATARLRVRRTSSARTLPLDFVGMSVRAVRTSDGAAWTDAPYTHSHDTLAVQLPAWRGRDDTVMVSVRYDGTPHDGLVPSTDATAHVRAFADNWPTRARFWFPSVDRPDDKATVRWLIQAPRTDSVIANGARRIAFDADNRPDTASGVTIWEERYPIPTYLMVIAAAPLARLDLVTCDSASSASATCVPQAAFVAPEIRDFLPGPFARAPEMVAYFTSLVGPFPYEKLWHVQSSTRFGGMENASAIFYADQPFRDRTMGDGVIAHETAHQWFGDAVTERTFADLWLSEGFATYFAALWAGHAHGDSAFRAEMSRARSTVLASPVSRERPVRDTAQADYMKLLNSNSYQKGAWVLHMLRGEIGDSAFFRGVRAYYAANRDGNATSDDLRTAMEASSGRDLRWFFTEWLTRPGAPAFSLARVADAGAGRATYEVRQTSTLPYAFPLTVAERGTGRRTTVRVPARRVARVTLPAGVLDLDPDVALLWAPGT